MAFRSFPGSDTALSLAANPVALPVMLTAAGVAVTVGAAAWSYHAYNAYKEKIHKKKIKQVNKLHKRFLEKIVISEYNEIQGFPPVFKLIPNEKSSSVESMHFTAEQIDAIGSMTPRGTDIALYEYRELILNAIQELKGYYLDRKKPDDITAGVLSYLLYMLESKCLNFAGYEYDIAYLRALSKFINAYASLEGTKNSQHFSRLTPVRSYLRSALQELENHKRDLSLKDMVSELSNSCVSTSKKMLKTFVKLISPENKWKHVNTATHDELTKGFLRRKYARFQIFGLKLWSDRAVKIPESYFQDWLNWLLRYFEESINPDSPMTVDDIFAPEQLFVVPDLTRLETLKKNSSKNKSKEARKEIHDIETVLNSMRQVFSSCENYITMKLDLKTSFESPNFVHILENNELVDRAKVLASFAALIHQVLSLQYLCFYLLKSIKQLGEIYVKNPHHFSLIFNVLEGLCNQIKQSVEAHKKQITNIQQQNNNIMQLESQELFPEETDELLEITFTTISRLGRRIQDYRDQVAKDLGSLTTETMTVKHEMFDVAVSLAKIFKIQEDGSFALTGDSTPEESIQEDESVVAKLASRKTHFPLFRLPLTFWQRHKYKILGGIVIGLGLLCMAAAAIISFFSGGLLSPFGAILGGLGVKVSLAGIGLALTDAVFGLVSGVFVGSVVDGAIVGVDAMSSTSSHNTINQKLGINRSTRLSDNQDNNKEHAPVLQIPVRNSLNQSTTQPREEVIVNLRHT